MFTPDYTFKDPWCGVWGRGAGRLSPSRPGVPNARLACASARRSFPQRQLVQLPHRRQRDERRAGVPPRGAGQRHERVGVDAGAQPGQLVGEGERRPLVIGALAGHPEDEVHVRPEAVRDRDPHRVAHGAGAVSSPSGGQNRVRAGLRADDDVVVGHVAAQQPHRLRGDVLRPDLGREAAEEDPPVRRQFRAHPRQQLRHRAQVRLGAVSAVGERGGGDEPHIAQPVGDDPAHMLAHARHGTVPEPSAEHERRLAEPARIAAPPGELDRPDVAAPGGERGEGVQRELRRLRRAERHAVVVAHRQARHPGQLAAVAQGLDQREDRGLALPDRAQVPAGVERVLRFGGGVHPAGDVQHAGRGLLRRSRSHRREFGRHRVRVGGVEGPQDEDRAGRAGGDLVRALLCRGTQPHVAVGPR